MNTAARLGLYAAGLVVAFFAAYGIAAVAVPDSLVYDWKSGTHTEQPGPDAPADHEDSGEH